MPRYKHVRSGCQPRKCPKSPSADSRKNILTKRTGRIAGADVADATAVAERSASCSYACATHKNRSCCTNLSYNTPIKRDSETKDKTRLSIIPLQALTTTYLSLIYQVRARRKPGTSEARLEPQIHHNF
jgi:hypothetical protein